MVIYESAMCCSTGLCGVSVDPELLRISTVISSLEKSGIKIERFNLTNSPMAFADNTEVNKLVSEIEWINKVASHANGNFAVIKWSSEEIKGDKLLAL